MAKEERPQDDPKNAFAVQPDPELDDEFGCLLFIALGGAMAALALVARAVLG